LNPYTVGHYQLEVTNDVFNDVGMSGLVVLPCCTRSAVWLHAVGSPDTVAVPDEWALVLTLYNSHMSACLAVIDCATWPHVLHAHDDPDVRRLGNLRACVGNTCV
jgi:hypothetical protein